jgi:hypothetical protein
VIDEVIERAQDNLKAITDRYDYAYEVGRDCLNFVAGYQWEEKELNSRTGTDRPVVTINKLGNYVNLVVNQNSMELARIKVSPNEDSDVDTARVINGLIRHIQYSDKSDAVLAYSQMFFDLVSAGFGYVEIDTEYCNEMSFDQELVINKVDDPFSVYLDPDGYFAFRAISMTKDEFKAKFGENADCGSWDIDNYTRKNSDDVVLLKYYEKTEEEITIYKIEIPETVEVEQAAEIDVDGAIDQMTQPKMKQTPAQQKVVTKEELDQIPVKVILEERTTQIPTVKKYILSMKEVLDESDWAGKHIPIVGAFSRKFYTEDGRVFFKPLVYDAKWPQKFYNFYKSQQAEVLMMAPKAPWVGAEGQFDGHEAEFEESNNSHVPYLEYKPVPINGQPAPPPQRQAPPAPSAGFYQEMIQASDEIKATTGLFDASLGAQGNETSGRAIIARKQQGNVSTYHFTAAFNNSLRQVGLILVDAIPRYYDTARSVRILGEDMSDEIVKINQGFVDNEGKPVLYDLTVGTYDVKVETGATSVTKREEAAESLLEFAKVVPPAGAVAPDIIAMNMDFERAEELAFRLKAGIDPSILARAKELEQGDKMGMSPERMQIQKMQQTLQQMQQMVAGAQQQLQGLGKENMALKKKIEQDKITVAQIKAEVDRKNAQLKAQTDLQTTQMDNRTDLQVEMIKQNAKPPMRPAAAPVPYANQR